ncbi:hypothetical protein ONE63_000741 [Megalurothrips usitatus]|uniref:Uncharacterized protein n=1 Tax=Megalurothrips usitatus TaxID=439358 RepID=A0AAV7Y1Y2_9NEOP|nr:hypothetical protein ONE63_000741 [Megalurothrips usitatus]
MPAVSHSAVRVTDAASVRVVCPAHALHHYLSVVGCSALLFAPLTDSLCPRLGQHLCALHPAKWPPTLWIANYFNCLMPEGLQTAPSPSCPEVANQTIAGWKYHLWPNLLPSHLLTSVNLLPNIDRGLRHF